MESMTGYGRGEASRGPVRAEAEARSVNNRYLDARVRLPQELGAYEQELRAAIKESFSRGSVQLNVSLEYDSRSAARLDHKAAAGLLRDLKALQKELGLTGEIDLGLVARHPAVAQPASRAADAGTAWEAARKAALKALAALGRSRRAEGAATKRHLKALHRVMTVHVRKIRALAPSAVAQIREGIRERVSELASAERLDQGRLEQEVAYLATRRDVSEELCRLEGHLAAMREIMDRREPVGRNLEFLAQEMHRELTTVASKAPSGEINAVTVQARVDLEKIREQVYNVQ